MDFRSGFARFDDCEDKFANLVLADVLDTTEAVVKDTIPTSFDNDAFDATREFNDWFENEIANKQKKRKPKPVEVLANALAPSTEVPAEDIFMNKADENSEYKQKKFPDSSDFQNQDGRSPDMLIIMRACFVLLLAMCKTLNEQSLKIANLSNPNFPVITISPTQSYCHIFSAVTSQIGWPRTWQSSAW